MYKFLKTSNMLLAAPNLVSHHNFNKPDPSLNFSFSDGMLRLWGRNGSALQHLENLKLHKTMGSANAFSADGHRLISLGKDGSYLVLDVRRCVSSNLCGLRLGLSAAELHSPKHGAVCLSSFSTEVFMLCFVLIGVLKMLEQKHACMQAVKRYSSDAG